MIIDFHTHSFPDKIAQGAVDNLSKAAHIKAFCDGTADGIVSSMAEGGIDLSVMLPVAVKASNVQSMNSYSAQFNERYADKGIFSFGCMHPDFDDWKNELSRVKQLGLKGIKIHPVYQGVNQDDVQFVRILEKAGELGLVVVSHAGLDIGFPGVVNSTPQMIANAVKQAGPVTFVAAHMGSWKLWEDVDILAELPNVYVDTAFSLGTITPRVGDDHYTTNDNSLLSDEQFCRLVHRFGADRVLFGSDNPWDSQKEALKKVQNSSLCKNDLDRITGLNAQRLLGI